MQSTENTIEQKFNQLSYYFFIYLKQAVTLEIMPREKKFTTTQEPINKVLHAGENERTKSKNNRI